MKRGILLTITSVLFILAGIAGMVLSIISLIGALSLTNGLLIGASALQLAIYAMYFFAGFTGMRSRNYQASIWLAGIILGLTVVDIIINAFSGGFAANAIFSTVAGLLLPVIHFIAVRDAKKAAQ